MTKSTPLVQFEKSDEVLWAFEEAAQLCYSTAQLYEMYSKQGNRTMEHREAFARDAETCFDLAHRIRKLKAK